MVDELEMIRTQMYTHNISENGRSAWKIVYDTNPEHWRETSKQ
jgi:hypothetical protein